MLKQGKRKMTEVYGHLAALAWIICQGLSATRYLSLGAYRRESRLNKTIISYIALQISCLIFFFSFTPKILLNIKFSSSLNQQTFLLLARTVPSLPNHKITRLKPQQIFRDLIWKIHRCISKFGKLILFSQYLRGCFQRYSPFFRRKNTD